MPPWLLSRGPAKDEARRRPDGAGPFCGVRDRSVAKVDSENCRRDTAAQSLSPEGCIASGGYRQCRRPESGRLRDPEPNVFGADVNPHLTKDNAARSNIGNGEPTNQPRRSPVTEERSSEESDTLSGHTEHSGRAKHVVRDR